MLSAEDLIASDRASVLEEDESEEKGSCRKKNHSIEFQSILDVLHKDPSSWLFSQYIFAQFVSCCMLCKVTTMHIYVQKVKKGCVLCVSRSSRSCDEALGWHKGEAVKLLAPY